MKILLIGKNGQVGWELGRALAPLGELVRVGSDTPAPLQADLADPDAITALIEAVQPQVIVNAAAYTAVDRAESDVDRARTVNAASPGAMARAALRLDATLVHYSTDYVFSGEGHAAWKEDAQTAPLNVYGHTKCEGEDLIRTAGCRHLILRTSWVYGTRGGNFAKTMLKLASERDRLSVVEDQIGAPTGADLIADVTAHAIRQMQHQSGLAGTYHLAAAGHTSWHGYAKHVIEFARHTGHPIKVRADDIAPVPSSAFPTPARRPLNSRLDTQLLRNTFGMHLPPWQTGVERMLTELLG